MKTYEVRARINARPEKVWSILTDAPRYPEWDADLDRIEGSIAPGEKIRVFTKLSPGRAFPATVGDFEANRGMTWSGGMPLGLFKGVRRFELTPQSDGGTELHIREVFSGPLLPLIGRSLPDFNPIFEKFAAALKRRAESGG